MADVDARLQQLTDNVLPTAPFLTSSSYLDRDSEPAKARHTASAASAATTTRAARPPPSQQQCQRQGQQPVFLHSGRTAARVFARGEEQLQYLTFLSYQDWDTSLVAVGGWSDAAGNLVVEEEEEEEEHGLFRKGQEARAARTPLGAPVAAPSTVRKAAATPSLPSEKAAAPTSAIATVTAPAPPPPLPTTGQDPPKARKKMSWNAYREIKTTGAREGRTDATSTATTATPAAPATAPAAAVQGVKREPPVTRPTPTPRPQAQARATAGGAESETQETRQVPGQSGVKVKKESPRVEIGQVPEVVVQSANNTPPRTTGPVGSLSGEDDDKRKDGVQPRAHSHTQTRTRTPPPPTTARNEARQQATPPTSSTRPHKTMGPRSPSLAGTTENSRTSPPPDRTASSDTSRAQRLRRPRPPLAERTLPRIWEDDFRELDPDLAPPSPTLPWPLVKNIPEVYDVFGAEYVAIMRARHPDLYYDPQIHRGHDHDLQSENDSESDGAAAVPGPLDAARAKPARTPASSSDGRQGQERPGARHRGEGTDGKAVVAASLSGKAQPALPRHPQEGRRSNATASAAGGVRNGGIGAKARPEQHQMAAPASTSASTSTSTSRRPSNSLQTPRLIVKLRYGRAKARQVRTILAGLPVVAARKRPISLVPDTRAKRSPSTTGATGLASSARRAGTPTRSSVSSTTGAAGVRSGITSGARSTASRNVSNSSAASDSSVMKRSASSPQGRRSSRSRPGNAAASSTSEAASVQDDAATTQQWEAESLHFWQLARELRQDCRQCPDEAFAVVLGLESLLASAMYCTIQEKLQQQQGAMTNPDLWEKNFLSLWREIRAKALKHETLQGLRLMLGAIVLGVVHEREMENAVEEGRQDPRLGRSNANGPDGNGSGNAEASRNGNGNGTGHRNGNGDGNQSDHSESSILEAEAKADRYYQTCDKALATYRRARQLWCMSEELLPRQEMEENFPDTWSKCHARTARQHKSKLTAPESYDWDDLVPISLVSTPLETVRFVYACLSEWAGEHQPTWKGQLHRKSG